ncbi:hypothetical protein HN51_034643 [Arachis hypogaea]
MHVASIRGINEPSKNIRSSNCSKQLQSNLNLFDSSNSWCTWWCRYLLCYKVMNASNLKVSLVGEKRLAGLVAVGGNLPLVNPNSKRMRLHLFQNV